MPDTVSALARVIVPRLTHGQSLNFVAFFPPKSALLSFLGKLYSAAFRVSAINGLCSPAVTELDVFAGWGFAAYTSK